MALEDKELTVPETKAHDGIRLQTGFRHTITVDSHYTAHVLELEDVFFHHNSAVMLPDFGSCEEGETRPVEDRITGLSVLAACLRHSEGNPAQKLLIAGHTDTSGEPDYNFDLSDQRVENVRTALEGERRAWVDIAKEKSKVEDYQQILNWVNRTKGYPCNCGKVDNIHGSKTTKAVKAFQRSYNQEYYPDGGTWNADTGGPIGVDGAVGEQTWGAFFDIYQEQLAVLLEADVPGLDTWHGYLNWLDDGQKGVGCGESHPIEEPQRPNFRSRRNRRVEFLWFTEGEEPDMGCHAGDICDPDVCRVYDPDLYRYLHIPCDALPDTEYDYALDLVLHEPETAPEAEFSLEPAGGGDAIEADASLADDDLRLVVRDDHGLASSDSNLLGSAGSAPKLDKYRSEDIIDSIQPRIPLLLKVTRQLEDGTAAQINEGQVHLEIEIEDPSVDLSGVSVNDVRTFVQNSYDQPKDPDGDSDNAITDFDGLREEDEPQSIDGLFESYDGSDATSGTDLSPEEDDGPLRIDVPASTEVDGSHRSDIHLVFTPSLQLGDNYRIIIRVVEDPNVEFRTGTWTHWKKVRIDAVVEVGDRADLPFNRLKTIYEEAKIIIEEPTDEQIVTLSEADWKSESRSYFNSQGIAIPNSAYQYGTFLFPAHDLGNGTGTATKGDIRTHRRPLARRLVAKALDGRDPPEGHTILQGPQIHRDWSSLNGTSLGDKLIVMCDKGRPASAVGATLSHELGHALYLRHSHTSTQKDSSGSVVTHAGARVVQGTSGFIDDHDPAYSARCLMGYVRHSATARFCGMCVACLSYWDKQEMIDFDGIKERREAGWGTMKIVSQGFGNAPGSAAQSSSPLRLRLLSDEETVGSRKMRKLITTFATWSSSNTGVATVNNSGRVTLVSAGSTTITAEIGSNSTTHNLTVT